MRTTVGRIAGERADEVTVYRGVPYARPTGELRLASPQPPEPWDRVRDVSGTWFSYYDGGTVSEPKALDIDMVPLAESRYEELHLHG
ncbi:carboxylesterase family protein [Streptomyces sp. LHD-70]|uniref:carboxylesterase family protein n=1 Tax=Streptomyces sp. LHD-70 TaxID=3072140 RepID=UPI00280D8862|nr:carboxylesterase family protein [Streptomyces sp. LHD-70]MDQ8707912.1 carboxylesterase family protein [Streptomyces sp. LHD-70]